MLPTSRRFALPLLLASVCGVAATPASAAPRAGDAAPAFTVRNARGGTVSLAGYKGKPLYLNFFASWCPPCNEEAPSVAALFRKYRARGLAIVGIDEQEEKSKALDFARKYRWPFAIGVDTEGEMVGTYAIYNLPVHVFIDKRGKLSTYRIGEMQPSEIEDSIRKIL